VAHFAAEVGRDGEAFAIGGLRNHACASEFSHAARDELKAQCVGKHVLCGEAPQEEQ